jgi:predicted transport protein
MQTAIYYKDKRFVETDFKLEKDLEQLMFTNSKNLFGQNSILIEAKKRIENEALGGTIPDAFLFDLKDPNNPEFYLIEVELAKHSFYEHIFPQITKFFAFFKNSKSQNDLIEKIYSIILSDSKLLDEFRKYCGKKEVYKYIKDCIENSENILLILDENKKELPEIINTYTDTWGKILKLALLKEYKLGKENIITLTPEFDNIDLVDASFEDETDTSKYNKFSEEYYLEGKEQYVKDIYFALKEKLNKAIPEIVFNKQRYYISLRKTRNFGFLDIRKKYVGLVALAKEDVIRERIKGYTVSSLSKSVQKFYNGDCAFINIDNTDNIDAVVSLLTDIQK